VWAQQQTVPPPRSRNRAAAADGAAAVADSVPPLEETGFRPIFDGQSMKGWDRRSGLLEGGRWRDDGGDHRGSSARAEHFCIWRGTAKPADFELKLQYKLTGARRATAGFNIAARELPDCREWVLKGYQADIDANQTYTGADLRGAGRGFLALPDVQLTSRTARRWAPVSRSATGAE